MNIDRPRRQATLRLSLLILAGALVLEASGQHLARADDSHAAASTSSDDEAFLAANETAMTRMMTAMAVKPSGDVDRDFVAMMIPHHAGAIEMAKAELRYGRDETLRRLAQEIIVTQRDEIAAMRLAIGDPPLPAPNQTPSASGTLTHSHSKPTN